MIVKGKDGWYVKSENHVGKDGKPKNLGGPYSTKAEAEKRLQQVEYFKHAKEDVNEGFVGNVVKAYLSWKGLISTIQDLHAWNNIYGTPGHKGISRQMMPQIPSKYGVEYQKHLANNGIKLEPVSVSVQDIKLAQSEYNKTKVMKLMAAYKSGKKPDAIIVSSDGYVLDGSHRFLAVKNMNKDATMDVLQANVKFDKLVDISRKFAHAEFRTVSDSKLGK